MTTATNSPRINDYRWCWTAAQSIPPLCWTGAIATRLARLKVKSKIPVSCSAIIPEMARVNFHCYAKPLFKLFELLKLSDPEFTTDSIAIKQHSTELQAALFECRALLAANWSGKDLPETPTYAQLLQFLTNMMSLLVDGTLKIDKDRPIVKVATQTTVETADTRTKSGKTTRKARERIVGYKLNFLAPDSKKVQSQPFTALERVKHLLPLQREDLSI